MSKLRLPNGEDHADAARKHLLDAQALLGHSRPDGAGYLSGYVVECALKTLWLHDQGLTAPGKMPWKGKEGHDLTFLASQVSTLVAVAGARIAKYFGPTTKGAPTQMAGWSSELRYRPEGMTMPAARAWCRCAEETFKETIAEMMLDGAL